MLGGEAGGKMARKLNSWRVSGSFLFIILMNSRCSNLLRPFAIDPKRFGDLAGLLHWNYMLGEGQEGR